jgi:DNA-binding transcriptional regulator YdaS (Cro superfamily)
MPDDQGLREAITAAGSVNKLAKMLGIHYTAILRWTRVPAGRIVEVERVTGISRARLRPDLYDGWREKEAGHG